MEAITKRAELARYEAGILDSSKERRALGIPDIKPLDQFRNAEEELADTTTQRVKARDAIKTLLPRSNDAARFVESLSSEVDPTTGLSDLLRFNRFSAGFIRDVANVASPAALTPSYLRQLWDNYLPITSLLAKPPPGAQLDLKNPAVQARVRANLSEFGETIKEWAASSGRFSPLEMARIEKEIDDAVLMENIDVVRLIYDGILQKLGAPTAAALATLPSATPIVSSTITTPASTPLSTYTPPSPLLKDIRTLIADSVDLKEAEYADSRDLISAQQAISNQDERKKRGEALIAELVKFYSIHGSKITADIDLVNELRRGLVLSYMLVFFTSKSGFTTFNALYTLTLGDNTPKTIIEVLSREGKSIVKHRAPMVGTGIPRTVKEKVIFGSIAAGNTNKGLQRQAINILRRVR